jgi:hypothetical protein
MPLLHVPQFITTTLNVGGGIDASQTTGIILQSDSGIDKTKPGMACITFADPLNTSLAEWVFYTSISGSNELVGVLRGQEGYSAKAHANGATVAFPISASHINNLAIAGATGWIQDTATWTRTGNHTFTVAGDRTAEFRKGTKVRYKDGGAFEYGMVASSSYSAPNTTVNLIPNTDFAMAAGTITDTWVSYVENPEGFPHTFNVDFTFDVNHIDNGTPGQQATKIEAKVRVVGNKLEGYAKFSGVKNNTNAYLVITTVGQPTVPVNQRFIGIGSALESSTPRQGTVYSDGTALVCIFSATIADNATIAGAGCNWSYYF